MTNATVFDVPMDLGLEIMPAARPDLADTEREALDGMVDEQDSIGPGMPVVDLERPDAGSILNGSVLVRRVWHRTTDGSRCFSRRSTQRTLPNPGPGCVGPEAFPRIDIRAVGEDADAILQTSSSCRLGTGLNTRRLSPGGETTSCGVRSDTNDLGPRWVATPITHVFECPAAANLLQQITP